MNRIIKFRAWDQTQAEPKMVEWKQLEKFSAEAIFINALDVILMQYTGLTDANGREIWEGDIVRVMSTNKKAKVFYYKCAFGINLTDEIFAPVYWYNDVQVIGNIYQNPDLL